MFSLSTTPRFVCNAHRDHTPSEERLCANCMQLRHVNLVPGPRQQVHSSFPVDSESMLSLVGLYDLEVDFTEVSHS